MLNNLVWFVLGCIASGVAIFFLWALVYVGGRHDAND